jgi:hypothetical protein
MAILHYEVFRPDMYRAIEQGKKVVRDAETQKGPSGVRYLICVGMLSR